MYTASTHQLATGAPLIMRWSTPDIRLTATLTRSAAGGPR